MLKIRDISKIVNVSFGREQINYPEQVPQINLPTGRAVQGARRRDTLELDDGCSFKPGSRGMRLRSHSGYRFSPKHCESSLETAC